MDKRTSKRGMMLLLSLFVVAFSSLYVTVGLTRAMTETRVARRFGDLVAALEAADATLDDAMKRLRDDKTWRPSAGYDVKLNSSGTTHGWIVPGGSGVDAFTCTGSDPMTCQFRAHGKSNETETVVDVAVEVTGGSAGGTPPAVHGKEGIQVVDPILLNAYDSSVGTYNPSDPSKWNQNADVIRTDSNAAKALSFQRPNIVIWGNILVGPGPNPPSIVVEKNCGGGVPCPDQRSGNVPAYSSGSLTLPPITDPSTYTGSCNGNITLKTTPLPLDSTTGTYCYNSLQLEDSPITATGGGPITVYVKQAFNITKTAALTGSSGTKLTFIVGGDFEINTDGPTTFSIDNKPANLTFKLYGNNSNRWAKVNPPGGTDQLTLYGQIYGPDRRIQLVQNGTSPTEIFGSVIGKAVELDTSVISIHTDVSTAVGGGSNGSGPAQVALKYWKQSPP